MSDWRATARQRVRLAPQLAPHLFDAAVRRARFTVVPRQEVRAPRAPFVALVAAVLLAGVVGLLLFNTHMQQGSFRATALEAQATRLHATQQSLEMELDRLRDPQEVAVRAQRLGMVPLADPAFLSLADGGTLGEVRTATREDAQRLTPLPTRRPADYRHPVRRIPWDADAEPGGAGTAGTAPSAGTDAGNAAGATGQQ